MKKQKCEVWCAAVVVLAVLLAVSFWVCAPLVAAPIGAVRSPWSAMIDEEGRAILKAKGGRCYAVVGTMESERKKWAEVRPVSCPARTPPKWHFFRETTKWEMRCGEVYGLVADRSRLLFNVVPCGMVQAMWDMWQDKRRVRFSII